MRTIAVRHLAVVVALTAAVGLGCKSQRQARHECPSPVSLGLNVRDMVDKPAQTEFESLVNFSELRAESEKLRTAALDEAKQKRNPNAPPFREKNVLCLSGGGSYGAFTAGVLCGWSDTGTRPVFDVVTGISTGALAAPLAFLGPAYDAQLKTFYTTYSSKDLYKRTYVRGLFGEALADNTRLADIMDGVLTPQLVSDIADAHRQGRRLYIGTTAAETKRFVVWDIGAIACKGRPQDRLLIKQILLASSAIPGFFPSQHITVELDGQCLTERHLDGGVSAAIFFHPPYVPPEFRSKNGNHDLAGTNIYCIVAGKLYADPQPIKPLALAIASQEVSAMIYAQTRGDLQRMFTQSMLTGMNFYMTSLPIEYAAPTSSTAFEIPALVGMFNEGYRIVCTNQVWRRNAPGTSPGENYNERTGTCLTYEVRGPLAPVKGKSPSGLVYMSDQGIPIQPFNPNVK